MEPQRKLGVLLILCAVFGALAWHFTRVPERQAAAVPQAHLDETAKGPVDESKFAGAPGEGGSRGRGTSHREAPGGADAPHEAYTEREAHGGADERRLAGHQPAEVFVDKNVDPAHPGVGKMGGDAVH